MALVDRALRILVILLVAVPLGPGGICCCVVGDGSSAGEAAFEAASPAIASAVAPAGTHGCCETAPRPRSSRESGSRSDTGLRAARHTGDGCGCTMREAAVEAAPTAELLPPAPHGLAPVEALVARTTMSSDPPSGVLEVSPGYRSASGPPVRLLLSVFRC